MSDTAKNGVNVQALLDARDALTKAPAAAQFKWRAACEWKNGTHSHSTVESFYGLGAEQNRKTTFNFDRWQRNAPVYGYFPNLGNSALA